MKLALILVVLATIALLALVGPLRDMFVTADPDGSPHGANPTIQSALRHTEQADSLLERGDVEQALLHLDHARHRLEVVPANRRPLSVLRGLARAWQTRGDRSRSLEALAQALREHPEDPGCALDLARLAWLDAVARMDESPLRLAREMVRRARAQRPEDPEAARLDRELESLRQAWDLLYREGRRDDRTLDALGLAFLNAARAALDAPDGPWPVEALLALDHGLRHLVPAAANPDRLPRADARRRELQAGFDDTVQSTLARTEQETTRHPRGAAFWFTRGEVLRLKAQRARDASGRDRALAAYDRVVEIDPGFGPAVVAGTHLRQDLGRDEEAFPRVEAAVEHLLREPAIHRPGSGSEAPPATAWRRPPRVQEAVQILLQTAGRAGVDARWKALAARRLERMLKRLAERVETPPDRDRADAWFDLGWLAHAAARTLDRPELRTRAMKALTHALTLDPGHAAARETLALIRNTVMQSNEEKP